MLFFFVSLLLFTDRRWGVVSRAMIQPPATRPQIACPIEPFDSAPTSHMDVQACTSA